MIINKTYIENNLLNINGQLRTSLFREDIYLNDSNIIVQWLKNKLNYKILDKSVIYRFKILNRSEMIELKDIESSINSEYRVYFDWIDIQLSIQIS